MIGMKKKLFIFSFLITILFSLSACTKEITYLYEKEGYTSIVKYELLGGKYKDIDTYIKNAYLPNSYIIDPNSLSENKIIKTNHYIEGWYRNYDEETQTFSDKWDFENDKILNESITLYPKWMLNIKYSFTLVTFENNEEKILHQYIVKENSIFRDSLNKTKRKDYTLLGLFKDKEYTEPWDEEYKHPGGKEDLDIKIYAKYIKGDYRVVRTKSELRIALSGNYNVYLMNDIDFENEEFSISNKYSKQFEGNGFTVKNITVKNSDQKGEFYVGLFKELDNATIQNVTFENINIQIKTGNSSSRVFVGTLSGKATDSTITNVNFYGSITILKDQKAIEIQCLYSNIAYELNNNILNNTEVHCDFEDLREE